MAFPSTARNGQTHNQFGKKFSYSEISGTWSPAVPLASVSEVRIREKAAETATTSYVTAVELPLSGNTAGQMAFVQETNRLYVWSGTGWYNVATITSAAAAISGANSTYTLATDGTPTVVTLSQSGLTSPTWSYAVTSSSLGRTATVTQVDNVFTITPSALAKNVGSFGLTFKATDGSNTIAYSSQFTMSNTAPVIGTAPSAAYALAEDGTPTIITLAATDADGHAITWSYEVVSGSLGGTAVSIVGSVFTITPSTNKVDAGEFQLRFIASDGVSFDAEVSAFTLEFIPDWATAALVHVVHNPNAYSTNQQDNFGTSIAMSGNYLIASAPSERDGNGTANSGAAYIFNVTTGALVHTLLNPNPYGTSTDDYFGRRVAIDGNYAVASAHWEDEAAGVDSGKAYIFNVTTGALVHTLNNPNAYGTVVSDFFGEAVAISGNYALISATREDESAGVNSGKAYIFNVTTGALVHTLNNPNAYGTDSLPTTAADDYFGQAVAISGNYAIVGVPQESEAGSSNSGYASGKVYIFDVTTGALIRTLANPNTLHSKQNDRFGRSLAISGEYVIVGTLDSEAGASNVGVAHVFNITTGAKVRTFLNPNPYGTTTGDFFSSAVAISGDFVIINSSDGSQGNGYVYIFSISTGALLRTIVNPDDYPQSPNYDNFGTSVAMSGDIVISSAPGEGSDNGYASGKVYIFQAG
jgi:hypothetical protein